MENNKYIQNLLNNISKEDLEREYCINFLNENTIAKKYNITSCGVEKLIKYFNLTRDQKEARKHSLNNYRINSRQNLLNAITKDTLEEYYINQDKTYSETLSHFNITGWTLDKLLREYNLKKDKGKTCYKGLQTKYNKAGGKANYIKSATEKSNQTKIEKYGSLENYYKIRQEKIEQANIEKYGFKHKATARMITEHCEQYMKVWHSEDESIKYLTSFDSKPTVDDLALKLKCSLDCIYLWVEKYNLGAYIKINKSRQEESIIAFITSLGFKVDRNNRKILNGQELDIYIPEKKVAIEFNGNYWHDITKVDKEYHYKKSYECEKQNIRLIHIYEYQWNDNTKQEILKSIIKNALGVNDNIIYARKCVIKQLTKNDVEDFSVKNSLHGHRNASIYLGLFYNDELVEVMTFGKAFFSRDNSIDYECIRSITKLNTTVIGGMNKLFKYFINTFNPTKILYYVDYNTHIGNSMEKLNFTFISYSKGGIINVSNCKEVTEKYGYVFNRKPQKHKEIQQYINEGKILSIYDAGVKKYMWTKN